jgi:hypothetical protein
LNTLIKSSEIKSSVKPGSDFEHRGGEREREREREREIGEEEMNRRSVCGWVVAILCFIILMVVTPAIPQSQEYHNFADQRDLFFGNSSNFNLNYYYLLLIIKVYDFVIKIEFRDTEYTECGFEFPIPCNWCDWPCSLLLSQLFSTQVRVSCPFLF